MKPAKLKKVKYLCVDTNIFIQCCLLEIDGDTLDVLKNELHVLLDKDKVKLLLPEVIKLEFYKTLETKIDSLANLIGKHKESINADNFNKKIKKDLIAKLEECAEDRRKISKKVKKEIELIFEHRNTIQEGLELTPQIFVEAYKRFLSCDKPFKKETVISKSVPNFQQDCLIIESLRAFLKSLNEYEFYFCSQNKTDFAEMDENGLLDIHRDIKKGFKHISYYENLGKLLNEKFQSSVSKETIQKLDDDKIASALGGISAVVQNPTNTSFYGDSELGEGEQLPDLLSK